MVLYGTGMRRSGLARLKIDDIDNQRMVIHVVNGKGGKDRDLPLSPKLLETLRAPTPGGGLSPRHICFPRERFATQSNRSPTRPCAAHLLGSGQESQHPQDSGAPFGSPQLGNPSA